MNRRRAFIAGVVVIGAMLGMGAGSARGDGLFVLVRHAEKEDGADPALTAAGTARAERLAVMLADAGIERVYTTDTTRTRDTARPLAAAAGVELRLYDPRQLDGFASELREWGGRALVVGHSNTTPELARALGGDGGEPIAEDEYDRLYLVTASGGDVSTVLLRYGESR